MFKILTLLSVLWLAAGCGQTKPNYLYEADKADPALIFTSDFALHTLFSVNIEPDGNNSCRDFRLAGYILHEDSKSIFDEPNKEFQIRVPAGRKVAVRALHSFNNGQFVSSCGPLYRSFTPEKGQTYRVNMDKIIDKVCRLSIANADPMAAPVATASFKTCR